MTWRRLARVSGVAAALVATGALVLPGAALARGFVGLSFGVPLGPPAYYYPPPPPPVYYYPPPAAYVVPGPPIGTVQPQGQTCREYRSTMTIDGRPQPVYGTACLQPDGSWRIIR
jgi:hypothetical protein